MELADFGARYSCPEPDENELYSKCSESNFSETYSIFLREKRKIIGIIFVLNRTRTKRSPIIVGTPEKLRSCSRGPDHVQHEYQTVRRVS